MSHVATIDIEVKDLDALADAAKRLGGELVRGQTSYKWWGSHVGDYPMPDGFTEDDLGTCEHALRFPDAAYEVGVVRRRDGRPGYTLLWDFIDGRLKKLMGGETAVNLKREYATTVATRQAVRSGFRVNETRQQDGSVRLVLSR
jgi:hypothetical protein